MKPLLIVLLLAGVLAAPTRGEEAAVLELEMSYHPPVPVLSAVPGRWSYRTTSLAAHSTNSLPRDVLTAYSGETILLSSRGSYDPDGGPIVQRAWYVEYDWAPNKTTFCRASDNYCLQTFNEAFTMIMPALPAGQDSLRIGMFLYVEDDEGQTREKHFVVEVRREGRRLYYARDMLGSVREVVDNHGRVVEVRDYDPWGLELPGRSRVEGVKTREGYTGHELDEESGMNYAGARYYDPAMGRWFVVDPLSAKYPGYSPYNYVLNNPLIFVDPDGREVRCHTERDCQDMVDDVKSLYADAPVGYELRSETRKRWFGLWGADVTTEYYAITIDGSSDFNWNIEGDPYIEALKEIIESKDMIYTMEYVDKNTQLFRFPNTTAFNVLGRFSVYDTGLGGNVFVSRNGNQYNSPRSYIMMHELVGHGHPVGNRDSVYGANRINMFYAERDGRALPYLYRGTHSPTDKFLSSKCTFASCR